MTRDEGAAETEALLREVNERIIELTRLQQGPWAAILCECSHPDCTATIDIELDEYEGVRNPGDRFALVAGHEDLSVERVVDRTDRFLVVEKISVSGAVVREADPRLGG